MAGEKRVRCAGCRWAAACLAGVYHEQEYVCMACGVSWLARSVAGEDWLDNVVAGIKLQGQCVQRPGWLDRCPACLTLNPKGAAVFKRKHGENMIATMQACGVAVCGKLEASVSFERVYGSYRVSVQRE